MRTTIDAAGRLVIPKSLRDAAGLRPGVPLQVTLHDGVIQIEPATTDVEFVDKGGIIVARAVQDVPALTADVVAQTLDQLRSERN